MESSPLSNQVCMLFSADGILAPYYSDASHRQHKIHLRHGYQFATKHGQYSQIKKQLDGAT